MGTAGCELQAEGPHSNVPSEMPMQSILALSREWNQRYVEERG